MFIFLLLLLVINIINSFEFKKYTCFTEIPEPNDCLMHTENLIKEYVSWKMKYEDGCSSTGFFFIIINIKLRLLQNVIFLSVYYLSVWFLIAENFSNLKIIIQRNHSSFIEFSSENGKV